MTPRISFFRWLDTFETAAFVEAFFRGVAFFRAEERCFVVFVLAILQSYGISRGEFNGFGKALRLIFYCISKKRNSCQIII